MGTLLYSFSLCMVLVMAPSTLCLLTLLLMLDAVPISSLSILLTLLTWSLGGTMRLIIDVPLPRAASRVLISFFTFHCSTAFSASSIASLLSSLADMTVWSEAGSRPQ